MDELHAVALEHVLSSPVDTRSFDL
jgi:hypothetical protein